MLYNSLLLFSASFKGIGGKIIRDRRHCNQNEARGYSIERIKGIEEDLNQIGLLSEYEEFCTFMDSKE